MTMDTSLKGPSIVSLYAPEFSIFRIFPIYKESIPSKEINSIHRRYSTTKISEIKISSSSDRENPPSIKEVRYSQNIPEISSVGSQCGIELHARIEECSL